MLLPIQKTFIIIHLLGVSCVVYLRHQHCCNVVTSGKKISEFATKINTQIKLNILVIKGIHLLVHREYLRKEGKSVDCIL